MGILTDTDLNKIIVEKRNNNYKPDKLLIIPFSKASVTPIGYDLRIGDRYSSKKTGSYYELKENDELIIKSGDTALIRTLERIEMPKNRTISGLISSKVSVVSQGITHLSTTIDADWKGNLLIAISNVSNETVKFKYGQKFCTAIFMTNVSVPTMYSNHEESRNDILFKEWTSRNKRMKLKNKYYSFLLLLIVPASTLIGWLIFGSAEGMSSFVAAGVAITFFLKE